MERLEVELDPDKVDLVRPARDLECLQPIDVGHSRIDDDAIDLSGVNHRQEMAEISHHRVTRDSGIGLPPRL